MTRTALVTRAVGLSVAVAATALVAPLPAGAGGLAPASTLAAAGSEVVLATDAAGNAAAAWVYAGQVQVARRAAGSKTWAAATTVSPAGVTGSDPDVSIGADGTVAVVWIGVAPGVSPNVEIALAPAGGAWIAARQVSDNPNWTDRDPQVEVGPSGVSTVVWAAAQNGTTKTVVRSKTASATSISTQDRLSADGVDGVFSGLSLARNAKGDTVAAWRLEGPAGSVQAARRPAGQAWTALPAVITSAVLVPERTSAAIDGAGNATIGWTQSTTTADQATPYRRSWPRAADLAAPAQLSTSPGSGVHVAANGVGQVATTWSAATGLWFEDVGAAAVALTSSPAAAHDLALTDSGAAAVAFAPASGGLVLAHRNPGSAWTFSTLSGAGATPVVGAHAADATAAWAEGGSGAVQARTLDNGAPAAVHLTAPMRVLNVGKKIKAGWIGADTWSPITYEVTRQVGTYRTSLGPEETWLSTTATDAAYAAKPGETVCLRVRGSDAGGNVGPFSVPRCATVPVNDKTLKQKKYAGRTVWKTVRKAKGAYSKDYTTTTRKGATLAIPIVARRIALLVSTGRGHGSVSVSLGKEKLGTFSLASAKAASQVVVPVALLPGVRPGPLKITVTTQGKPVRIDGVYAGLV